MRIPFAPLVLTVVSSLLIPHTVPLALAGDPQWVEIRSPHFSVVTDAGEKRGREAAVKFEQLRAVFGAILVKAKVNLPIPLQIVAFRNTKELRQFAPLWHGKPTEVAKCAGCYVQAIRSRTNGSAIHRSRDGAGAAGQQLE